VRIFLLLTFLVVLWPWTATGAPRVVASILPVHSLVSSVMQGVGEPALLVRGAVSPHLASLRPSSVRLLHRADLVFWIGDPFETWLRKPLSQAGNVMPVDLIGVPGVELLPLRAGGARQSGSGSGRDHPEASVDPHIWLDPRNAIAMAGAVVQALERVDPVNADRYRGNGATLVDRLQDLDRRLAERLEPVRNVPFVVFHDAYQYFEHRYRLRSEGSVTLDVELGPGARRTREIRARITELGVVCLFSEPQFQSPLLPVLLEDTGAVAGELDPLGAEIEPGPGAYFQLLDGLASSVYECLAGASG
jgi:zinc transport system substrate-binding protein